MRATLKQLLTLVPDVQQTQQLRYLFSSRCMVTKTRRRQFVNRYDALLVFQDGSALKIKHPEPVAIVKMPFCLSDCKSPEETYAFKNRRRILQKYDLMDDSSDITLDRSSYLKMFKPAKE